MWLCLTRAPWEIFYAGSLLSICWVDRLLLPIPPTILIYAIVTRVRLPMFRQFERRYMDWFLFSNSWTNLGKKVNLSDSPGVAPCKHDKIYLSVKAALSERASGHNFENIARATWVFSKAVRTASPCAHAVGTGAIIWQWVFNCRSPCRHHHPDERRDEIENSLGVSKEKRILGLACRLTASRQRQGDDVHTV